MTSSTPTRRLALALAAAAAVAAALGGSALSARSSSGEVDACGVPTVPPRWIEYGEGALPQEVRAVFARPGVTVATSGTALPRAYRERGASTVFFVLRLPQWVGTPAKPHDASSIDAAAQDVYERAVVATECETPIVGLNELLGPSAPVPWEPNVAAYRANVLALLQGLADRGARPALLVHGSPGFAGEAAVWWEQVGEVADVVYQAYYKAPNISRLGRIVGPRRMRLGMRSIIRKFATVGVPRERIGLALGFQVAPGKWGREGLQRDEWLRFVKWNALAARQVTLDERTTSVWSWGWATFGPPSVDPDKPAAACVYLWARDQALCDGPAAAGPGFKRSLVEGPIVVPAGVECVSVSGKLRTAPILALAKLTRDRQQALDGLFARQGLRKRVPIAGADVLEAEQEVVDRVFFGQRLAYELALKARGATGEMARGILEDELRRQAIAELAAADGKTALLWATEVGAADIATATCRRDLLPGRGNFPASDVRVIGAPPIAAKLPFLLDDREPPSPAPELTATSGAGVTLDWADGVEPDLAGYVVYRGTTPGGPYTRLTPTLLPYSTYADKAPLPGPAVYVVRAMDTSGNLSAQSVEAAIQPAAP